MTDVSDAKRPRRTRFLCECLWCGRVWYVRGTRARRAKFCNHKHFGKYLNWQATLSNPDKNRERHVRRCPGCRSYRPVSEFLNAQLQPHDTCLECRGEKKSVYAKVISCRCVDCKKVTDGEYRCKKCKSKFLDKYIAETGEEHVADAYDPLNF